MNELRFPLFFSFFNAKNLNFLVKNEGFLTAQFLDFFACFLREEFFVIKFPKNEFFGQRNATSSPGPGYLEITN